MSFYFLEMSFMWWKINKKHVLFIIILNILTVVSTGYNLVVLIHAIVSIPCISVAFSPNFLIKRGELIGWKWN